MSAWIDRALLAAAALLLAGSLLRPSLMLPQDRFDHLVILDITQSMYVADYLVDARPVTRLNHAKQLLRRALLRLPCGSRVGWGVFTEYRSFLLLAPVEVCANLVELRASLDAIDNRLAWVGNSEVAKGLYAGLSIARQLPGVPSLVFVSDGHEAPPLSSRHLPKMTTQPGEVAGVLVGVGDLVPRPIPKLDPEARTIGTWGADEVMQTDPYSRGRAGSVSGERMVEEGPVEAVVPAIGATPGSEQLSSLREAHLRALAGSTGLGYLALRDEDSLVAALTAPSLARKAAAPVDLGHGLAGVALLLVLARLVVRRRRRSPVHTRIP